MDTLHAGMAPLLAAWMGGALLSLASAGLKQRVGMRTRPAAAPARRARRGAARAAAAHR
jgi:hypothetical protein